MSDNPQTRKEGSVPHLIPGLGQAHVKGDPGDTNIKVTNATQEDFDEYGAELRHDARVWKVYVREADKFDAELVDGWNRSLDVTLIFAALFTAICTAFVIESSKSLKKDSIQAAEHRLDQMASILLVIANLSDPSQIKYTTTSDSHPFSPRSVDLCVNILWFFSLILSAAVSLLAILAKEWCHLFMTGRIGDPWSQTKRRQRRWKGIEKWKMEQVIMILPSFIHLAFLSFAIGLCIYLGDLNWRVAILASIVTFGSMAIYMASTILPLLHLSDVLCPYSTSISRIIQHFRGDIKSGEHIFEHANCIAIEALAWLIKTSDDPKSTDIALQAIAGADPNAMDRELLKESGADKMISEHLLGLDPESINYEKVIDLYARAHSFFWSSSNDSVRLKAASTPVSGAAVLHYMLSSPGYRKGLFNQPQRGIRDLRGMINQQITAYITSPNRTFQPTLDNIRALHTTSTAASHCLRALRYGTQLQMQGLFDPVVDQLGRYRNKTSRLNDQEFGYLMIGTAMLLSSLLVKCPTDIGARNIMPLIRLASAMRNEEKQLRLEYLGLPLIVYAISRRDYPGWIQPYPLSPASRAERAIEVITYYVKNPSELRKAYSLMINLALLELLSDPMEYNLDHADIVAINESFTLVVDSSLTYIYTFPNLQYMVDAVGSAIKIISNECDGQPSENTVTFDCLTVLNRAGMDQLATNSPMGDAYAFLMECILDMRSSGPKTPSQATALNLMQKFHDPDHRERIQNLASNLVQSLERRYICMKLREKMEREVDQNDADFVLKLFATGQAWFLIDFAIKLGATDYEGWRRCLKPFIWNENVWDSPELAIRELEEWRSDLAEQYKEMWDNDSNYHAYFGILYRSMTAPSADSPPNGTYDLPGPFLHPPHVLRAALQQGPGESETKIPEVETPPPTIQSNVDQDRELNGTGLSVPALSEDNPQSNEHKPNT